jgi:Ti-type conjugative transfer relaxase TraA
MAIYFFRATFIKRSKGQSAVHAAAYRSASRLHDYHLGRTFDYTAKPDVIHSDILAPEGSPEWARDREILWNAIEARENRRDAQLATELKFALPEELTQSQAIALAREFVQREFVARGRIADLNVHWDQGNPHAHVMRTLRQLGPDGFGFKESGSEWRRRGQLVTQWREHWADAANEHLLRAGLDIRIDHRSYREQGIELEPTICLRRAVTEVRRRGERPQGARRLEELRERNARRIEQRPEIVFDKLTRQRSTFARHDLAREVVRYVDDVERFRGLMMRLERSPELVTLVLGTGGAGNAVADARYTTRAMLRVEQRIAEIASQMADVAHHPVRDAASSSALLKFPRLSVDEREAVWHLTSPRNLEAVTGLAGSGKSAAIAAAKDAWEASGYRVHGATFRGIVAENLQKYSGVESGTLASWELAWKSGRVALSRGDIFVIDEAGMVGTRQMARVLSKLYEAGAKAVLIGDAAQLEPMAAGAAFRAIAERAGSHEVTGIRRVTEPERLIDRFMRMQRDFGEVVARFDLDPAVKARAVELRLEMRQTAKDISNHKDLMREAARAGIASEVKSLAREDARGPSEEKGFELEP